MNKILNKNFYKQDTLKVAENLIGKYLVKDDEAHMIIETEAYNGPHDKASHAHKGRTDRTEVMFGSAGLWYVYLVYGMYWMLNIVTSSKDYPAAVLIRGVKKFKGPGILTRELGVTDKFNNKPADESTGLWIEDREKEIEEGNIKRTPRIGVDYAKEWKNKPYRFVLKKD